MKGARIFLRVGAAFEPCELAEMGQAYDKIYSTLRLHHASTALKEALAADIIGIASMGTCDSNYLAETILERIAHCH